MTVNITKASAPPATPQCPTRNPLTHLSALLPKRRSTPGSPTPPSLHDAVPWERTGEVWKFHARLRYEVSVGPRSRTCVLPEWVRGRV